MNPPLVVLKFGSSVLENCDCLPAVVHEIYRYHRRVTAEWRTSFPAQTLAGKGYAVLMLNRLSPGGQSLPDDPVKARELEGWQMLSTFENAVQLMIKRGVADPERMAIYGWSHGGFIVEFPLAHSRLNLHALARDV